MNQQPVIFHNPLPHAMRSGLSLGLLFSANFLLSTSSSAFMQVLTYFVIALIALSAWRYVCRFRDTESEGTISFYRAFSYVFLLFFFAALISAAVKLVYLKYINTNYLVHMISATEEVMQQLNLGEMINDNPSWKSIVNPINFIMQSTMLDTLLGALLGLCYAPFVKRTESKH